MFEDDNDVSYVKNMSNRALINHIKDCLPLDHKRRDMLDFDEHIKVLISRWSKGRLLTKAQARSALIKADFQSVRDVEILLDALFE